MMKSWVSLLGFLAVVSAVPVASNSDDATTASAHLTNGHSFFESRVTQDAPAPVKDYCGSIPQKPSPKAQQTATATFSNQASFATLGASVHWSFDTKPAENVIPDPPETGSKLYYGVDSMSSGPSQTLSHSTNIDRPFHVWTLCILDLQLHHTICQSGSLRPCHCYLQQ